MFGGGHFPGHMSWPMQTGGVGGMGQWFFPHLGDCNNAVNVMAAQHTVPTQMNTATNPSPPSHQQIPPMAHQHEPC